MEAQAADERLHVRAGAHLLFDAGLVWFGSHQDCVRSIKKQWHISQSTWQHMLKKLILKQTWPLIYQTKNSKTCLMQEQIHLIVLEGSQTTLQGCFAGQSDINSQISRIGSSFCQLQLFPPGINLHTGYCQVSTTYTL